MNWQAFFSLLRATVADRELPSVSQIGRDGQSPFRILISTVISLRTKDSVTLDASLRLFARAPDPASLVELTATEVEQLIFPAGFYRQKAKQIQAICRIILQQYGGQVPTKLRDLLALPGVGLKTANLTLSLGFGIPAICVDTHVHRICNRLGWIRTDKADQSEAALRSLVPESYWMEINELFVKFGQDTCTPLSPFCSHCPFLSQCARAGVTKSR